MAFPDHCSALHIYSVVIVVLAMCALSPHVHAYDARYRTSELFSFVNENVDILSEKALACGCPEPMAHINPAETVDDGDEVIAGIFQHCAENTYEEFLKMMKFCGCVHHDPGAQQSLIHLYRFEMPSVRVSPTEVERDMAPAFDAMAESIEQCCQTLQHDRDF
eukprot:PhM_4_TR6432/c0_g1_i1/m.97722